METRALLVDAFTDEPLAGNVAGVVPEAGDLTDAQMGAVARELGASETAFLRPTDDAARRIRYFTPAEEVDLCGHATVASLAALRAEGGLGAGEAAIETNAGRVAARLDADDTAWFRPDVAPIEEVGLARDRVADALGVEARALVSELPLAVATAGVAFLVVPVDYLSTLRAATPDRGEIEALSREAGADGVYAFTFDTLGADATLHARAFAPAIGVPEDPVTGTASAAVGAYLDETGAFDDLPEELVFEQGHVLGRPGRVRVRVGEGTWVGGRAVVSLDGTLSIPEPDGDDIVEA